MIIVPCAFSLIMRQGIVDFATLINEGAFYVFLLSRGCATEITLAYQRFWFVRFAVAFFGDCSRQLCGMSPVVQFRCILNLFFLAVS